MGFVKDLTDEGFSTAVRNLFEHRAPSTAPMPRSLTATEHRGLMNSGPVISYAGIFHKGKSISVEGPSGWRIETVTECPNFPPDAPQSGRCNTYKTVKEAQENSSKPCERCYAEYPKSLTGLL